MKTPVGLLVLDIDGTVREGYEDPLGLFVNGPEDVRVFPEAVARMREWKERGGRVIGVSNQGGIALGLVDIGQVALAMVETQAQTGGLFDRILFCRHHPRATDPEMARCWCRKPRAGLVIEGALSVAEDHPDEFYPPYLGLMVGDRPEDEGCADAASLDFMAAVEWRSAAR